MVFIVKTEFDVDDHDAKAIAEILKTNKTLTSIDVYHKDITVDGAKAIAEALNCLLYTSPSPRDGLLSRMPSSA